MELGASAWSLLGAAGGGLALVFIVALAAGILALTLFKGSLLSIRSRNSLPSGETCSQSSSGYSGSFSLILSRICSLEVPVNGSWPQRSW